MLIYLVFYYTAVCVFHNLIKVNNFMENQIKGKEILTKFIDYQIETKYSFRQTSIKTKKSYVIDFLIKAGTGWIRKNKNLLFYSS